MHHCKIGSWDAVWARVRANGIFFSFPDKTHPIHYFRSKTHVLGGFAPFGCRKCTVAKSDPRMPFYYAFRPMKHLSRFSAKIHPIHSVWSKAHVLGSFAPFGSRKCTIAKSGRGMLFGHELGPMEYFLVFQTKRIQSTTLCPKLTFWEVSHHLVAASAPL